MSFKAKDLTYDANEPLFLRKLRSQYGDTSGRLQRPAQRPRKLKEHDDDDEPTYVYEESNEVLTKEQYEELIRETTDKKDEHQMQDRADQEETALKPGQDARPSAEREREAKSSAPKQTIAEIGGPRKRKQVKVIGDENTVTPENIQEPPQGSRKPKQTKKKIKLSFDEA